MRRALAVAVTLAAVTAAAGAPKVLPGIPSPARPAPRSPAAPVTEPEPDSLSFVLREMRIVALGRPAEAPLVLKAGRRYRLSFVNRGQLRHEVSFGRGVVRVHGGLEHLEHLLSGVETEVSGRSGPERRAFEIEALGLKELELQPDASLSVAFTLPESARGAWELGCFAPGHHDSGMHLALRVE